MAKNVRSGSTSSAANVGFEAQLLATAFAHRHNMDAADYELRVRTLSDGLLLQKCSINHYPQRTSKRFSEEYFSNRMLSNFTIADMRIKGAGLAVYSPGSKPDRPINELWTGWLFLQSQTNRHLSHPAQRPKNFIGAGRVPRGSRPSFY